MKKANWAEWSINHKQIIYFFAFLILVMGIYSFKSLGRSEDPSFTVKQMVVYSAWPGASAEQVENHLTNTLEKQIQASDHIDHITSYSRPGSSVITVYIKDEVPPTEVRQHWFDLRNLVNDAKRSLPEGVVGPFFDDHFDDVYGNIYAITGDDFSYEEKREYAEKIKLHFYSIPDVKKVELIGMQPEKIYIQMQTDKLAQLGLDIEGLAKLIKAQTAIVPSGMVETDSSNAYLRLTGATTSLDALREIPINAQGRVFRLGDIAQIKRAYEEPAKDKMYFNGHPAVGIALSMEDGGDNIELGKNLAKAVAAINNELPLGMSLEQVANQPEVVESSINEFSKSLYEAIIIVLAVSLFSLGRRCGYVISCCIPLILLGTFCSMYLLGIDLHKISLGALIVALGMLVDDAIVVVELMEVKMSEGWDRTKAASYAFQTCAWPLLTGTVITCLGFMPIAFSHSSASEFAVALFPVMSITLLLSWLISATLAPVLGHAWIKPRVIKQESFDTPFYNKFRSLLNFALRKRVLVLSCVVALFFGSLFMTQFIRQEFFPASVRPELLVELNLPEGSSVKATDATAQRLTKMLEGNKDIENITTYVGKSAPRFVLVIDPVHPRDNYAQLVIKAKDIEARKRLETLVSKLTDENFPNVIAISRSIPLGPPAPYPVMLRVSGADKQLVKEYAQKVRQTMEAHPYITQTRFDWMEQSNAVKLVVDNDKLLQMGLTRQTVAMALQAQVSGYPVASYLEGDQNIDLVFRLDPDQRADISQLETISIPTENGAVPLSQVAHLEYGSEDNMIWRRNLLPTITVCGDISEGVTGNDVTKQIYEQLKDLREQAPNGISIEIAGSLEDSQKTLTSLLKPVPIMLISMIVLLMLQLQDIRKLLIIVLTVPLGLIGVIWGLLIFDSTLGFMAELGVLALAGIIIRNSVVLIDQIQQHLDAGMTPIQAITESAIVRFRPIMLAAFTTVLGLIPLFASDFWNAIAVAIASGLTGATLLTLIILPVLYAIIYRVKHD